MGPLRRCELLSGAVLLVISPFQRSSLSITNGLYALPLLLDVAVASLSESQLSSITGGQLSGACT